MHLLISGIGIELPATLPLAAAAIVCTALLYLWRLARRRYMESNAERWPRADATVVSSYEIDENSSATSPSAWLENEDDNREHVSRWATAIQYAYRVQGELYAGTYFLPGTNCDGHLATAAGRAWVGRQIVVRYNPNRVEQSVFLVEDGAPGRPHIPTVPSDKPYVTSLSLQ